MISQGRARPGVAVRRRLTVGPVTGVVALAMLTGCRTDEVSISTSNDAGSGATVSVDSGSDANGDSGTKVKIDSGSGVSVDSGSGASVKVDSDSGVRVDSGSGASTNCSSGGCKVTFARGADVHMQVLGVDTEVVEVRDDQVILSVDGQRVSVKAGGRTEVSGVQISAPKVTDKQVVLEIAPAR